ncbi:unannotated protein [freshwater metagenome]|uniref:Unannotated protein n=1 Tax=freshwater metagenome TaxID=449393 RepID=A0A6J5Z656_9ZZZZ
MADPEPRQPWLVLSGYVVAEGSTAQIGVVPNTYMMSATPTAFARLTQESSVPQLYTPRLVSMSLHAVPVSHKRQLPAPVAPISTGFVPGCIPIEPSLLIDATAVDGATSNMHNSAPTAVAHDNLSNLISLTAPHIYPSIALR